MWVLLLLQAPAVIDRDWLPTIVSLCSLILFIGGGFKAYGSIIEKMNGLGTRVTSAEGVALKALTLAEATKEDLSEGRREMMTMLWNSEKAATDRATQMQVSLARMAERLDLDTLVHSVVQEVTNPQGRK